MSEPPGIAELRAALADRLEARGVRMAFCELEPNSPEVFMSGRPRMVGIQARARGYYAEMKIDPKALAAVDIPYLAELLATQLQAAIDAPAEPRRTKNEA